MLIMPFSRDQPDVAARVAARGVGRSIPRTASIDQVARAIQALLADEEVGRAAHRFASVLADERNPDRAPDIIEEAIDERG